MKIGILGGSFDPPHLGHYLIARQVIEFAGIDQVWLLPNYSTEAHHKIFQKKLSPPDNRLEMSRLMEDKFIKVSDFEIKYNQDSITIITLRMLYKKYPGNKFYWITGSDKLINFNEYDEYEDLIKNHNLIVFPREHMLWDLDERVKSAFNLSSISDNIIVLNDKNLVLTNISSTLIRDRVRKKLSIKYLVQEKIEKYITDHNLYLK